jgi:hypothetical protein
MTVRATDTGAIYEDVDIELEVRRSDGLVHLNVDREGLHAVGFSMSEAEWGFLVGATMRAMPEVHAPCAYCGKPTDGPGAVMRPSSGERWCAPTCAASWSTPAVAELLKKERGDG